MEKKILIVLIIGVTTDIFKCDIYRPYYYNKLKRQFIGVNSAIEERLKQDFFSIYKHTAIEVKEIINEHVTPDKIKYFLFTKENPDNFIEIDPSNPSLLAKKNVKIVFIIHGWASNREADWYEDLKNAFSNRKEEYYVVQVDWSEPANQLYTVSSWNTKDVGNIIGEFLVDLHENYKTPLSKFLLVGHSLGGQISGYIGKKVQALTNQKLPRIIALDPAGPFFSTRPEKERLNKNDAEVVQVIHTDGGTFGFKGSIGTIDFFPNGGSFQPGCAKIDLLDVTSVAEPISCSHLRGPKYFVEALLNAKEFLAKKCSSWSVFKSGLCGKEQMNMGNLEAKLKGNFYLETNNERPFARRSSGLGLHTVISLLPG